MILHYGDLIDGNCLVKIINDTKPTEIYNLGAQSHVKVGINVLYLLVTRIDFIQFRCKNQTLNIYCNCLTKFCTITVWQNLFISQSSSWELRRPRSKGFAQFSSPADSQWDGGYVQFELCTLELCFTKLNDENKTCKFNNLQSLSKLNFLFRFPLILPNIRLR